MHGCLAGLVTNCSPGWAEDAHAALLPGAHVIALGPWSACIEARRACFEVRDTVLVLSPRGARFAFLLRKPCAEKTVAENVLRHGTGALNIAATRVAHASASDFEKHKAGVEAIKARGGSMADSWKNSSDLSGASDVTTAGRWPSNLVLVHGSECRRAGTKRVPNIGGSSSGMSAFGQNSGWNPHNNRVTSIDRHRDLDGLETIAAWACEPGCPVAELDAMSGERKTTYVSSHHQNNRSGDFLGALQHPGAQGYDDSGGASRFFPQFESEDALRAWFEKLIGI
jgi:hypothetical protein